MIGLRIVRGLLAGLLLAAQPHVSAKAASANVDTAPKGKDWQTWSPYRPGLYFGVRPNIPETLLMGLMWGNGTDKDSLANSVYHLPNAARSNPGRRRCTFADTMLTWQCSSPRYLREE